MRREIFDKSSIPFLIEHYWEIQCDDHPENKYWQQNDLRVIHMRVIIYNRSEIF